MKMPSDPSENRLIAALAERDRERWLPQLEPVELRLGQALYESGGILSHVYFPTTAIVSLLYVDGKRRLGRDRRRRQRRACRHFGLHGGRVDDQPSGRAKRRSCLSTRVAGDQGRGQTRPGLHLLLRYTQALITQMSQTAVCNRLHTLDQQLCRWLLLSLDRLQGSELVMTQELIANMLGVRRQGVTEVAHKLQDADLIRYARGRILVRDRKGLERRSCECYAVVKKRVRPAAFRVAAT